MTKNDFNVSIRPGINKTGVQNTRVQIGFFAEKLFRYNGSFKDL